MDVIVLRREMNDPEATVGGGGDGTADGGEDPLAAQAADGLRGAQSDVDGMDGDMRWPLGVGHARSTAFGRLAAGTGTSAAPRGRNGERELQRSTRHIGLDSAIIVS